MARRFTHMQNNKEANLKIEWWRGKNANFYPTKSPMSDITKIKENILKGWLPDAPFINKGSKVVALGSCFAREISNFLVSKKYSTLKRQGGHNGREFIYSGVNNTFAVRQLFEFAWTGKEPKDETWHSQKGPLHKELTVKTQKELSEYFSQTKAFIITLGLSEVWYNKKTSDVFWRAIPKDIFDSDKHGFRVTTVQENVENIQEIIKLIKIHAPDAKIILTLSPVPLYATFRPVSCVSASAVSKSILRVAVDEVMRDSEDFNKSLFYWPSYEIITSFFKDPYKEDNRHIEAHCVSTIMSEFSKYFIQTE